MSVLQTIQAEIITGYQAITLPNSIGAPTGYKHEPKGGFKSGDLPAVVVERSILISRTPIASGRVEVVREYIADLFCYTKSDSDPVNATSRDKATDCVDTVQEYFDIYGLTTAGVIFHNITADTNDTELFSRDNLQHFIGVRFRHEVTYYQFT